MSALNFKQFFHIWTQQLLNWLTVKFNSIDIDTSDLAKEAKATSNKNEILTKIENTQPDLSTVAKQGTNPSATLTATQAAVVDGNDTSVSVGKEIRSEVGTSSDTASETGTLSAVLKWTKNKVKDIYTAVTGITGYALQGSDSTKSITSLDADLGDVAAALEYMQQGGMPQIAQIAKQGSNSNANISDIQAKIGTPASGQATTLFGAIGDVALSAQTLQSLANSWSAMVTNRQTLQGYTFTDSIDVANISAAVFRQDQLLEIDDDSVTVITVDTPLQAASSLRKLRLANCVQTTQRSFLYGRSTMIELDMPSLEVLGGPNSLQGLTNLSVLNMPNLKQITGSYVFDSLGVENVSLPSLLNFGGERFFNNATKMKECHVPNLQVSRSSTFLGCTNLILLELGANMTSSFNIGGWSPTNALNASSQTLLTPEDITAGFTSNLQKLLYNIREHIAANLPVSNNTVTFSSAVKAAILADQATADAFTNKGWTIA